MQFVIIGNERDPPTPPPRLLTQKIRGHSISVMESIRTMLEHQSLRQFNSYPSVRNLYWPSILNSFLLIILIT